MDYYVMVLILVSVGFSWIVFRETKWFWLGRIRSVAKVTGRPGRILRVDMNTIKSKEE